MLDFQPARGLQHVKSAGQIAVDIGARIFETVTHTRLGSQVDDHIGLKLIRHPINEGRIFQHPFGHGKAGGLPEPGMALLFQAHVIVIRHPVKTMHLKTLFQKQLREMKADEAGRAGNENFAGQFRKSSALSLNSGAR